MTFGDVIRSAASPSSIPNGIGGNSTTIWHTDGSTDMVYELDVIDFSMIRSAAITSRAKGIGGDETTIWYCDGTTDMVYELDIVDLSIIRGVSSPSSSPSGIGGTNNVIWHSDIHTDQIYELSIVDFSVIRNESSPSGYPYGIGGDENYIWHSDTGTDLVYELDTNDFSIVRSKGGFTTYPYGIGGDSNTMWLCINEPDKIYELDADTNSPPVADAGGPYEGVVDSEVSFDGSGSTDFDGSIVLHEWDFGDGLSGEGITVTHPYVVADTYTVALTVTDDGGLTDIDSTIVTISESVAIDDTVPDSLTFGYRRKHHFKHEV